MKHTIIASALALALGAGAASAATLSGIFNVTAVNVTGVSGSASQANMADYNAALAASGAVQDNFGYSGALDFATSNTSDNPATAVDEEDITTVEDWLLTGGGTITDLDTLAGLSADGAGTQLSKPDIGSGTATTTFFLFELVSSPLSSGSFTVTHDDGFRIFDDTVNLGGVNGPIGKSVNTVTGFDGGMFSILYVATNGDPSILHVDTDAAPVPLPASLPLLAVGFGGLFWMRRRKAA